MLFILTDLNSMGENTLRLMRLWLTIVPMKTYTCTRCGKRFLGRHDRCPRCGQLFVYLKGGKYFNSRGQEVLLTKEGKIGKIVKE